VFVGRQYHFEVDGDDLLHRPAVLQQGFVVVELNVGRFQPEDTGKLGCYVAWL